MRFHPRLSHNVYVCTRFILLIKSPGKTIFVIMRADNCRREAESVHLVRVGRPVHFLFLCSHWLVLLMSCIQTGLHCMLFLHACITLDFVKRACIRCTQYKDPSVIIGSKENIGEEIWTHIT